MKKRKETKKIYVGSVAVGGESPVSIQSMTNTVTKNVESTVAQIKRLESVGCEIVRIAVPDHESAKSVEVIKKRIGIPLIADIHFDYELAVESFYNGADCVRINPGNIGSADKVIKVIEAAKANDASIRIGVNSGSLENDLLKKYGITSDSLVESALRHVDFMEKNGFYNFKVSVKASSVPMTIDAYEKLSEKIAYPLHIGVTEAGTTFRGIIKSSVGLGSLLSKGIGDTLRVSLTGDPSEEIKAGWEILKSLNIRKRGAEFISCPTCGRTEINLVDLAEKVEKSLEKLQEPLSIAVMGCPVNGPGEARDSDYGIAGGKGVGVIFKHGKVLIKKSEDELLSAFLEILRNDGYDF